MMCLRPIPGMTTYQQASSLSNKILNLFSMIVTVRRTNEYAEVFLEPCQLTLHPCVVQKRNVVTERRDYTDNTPPALIQPMDGILPKWSQRLKMVCREDIE